MHYLSKRCEKRHGDNAKSCTFGCAVVATFICSTRRTLHLLKSRLSPDSYVDIENREEVLAKLQSMALAELFIDILGLLQQATNASRLDFLDISLSDENYIAWTRGVSRRAKRRRRLELLESFPSAASWHISIKISATAAAKFKT